MATSPLAQAANGGLNTSVCDDLIIDKTKFQETPSYVRKWRTNLHELEALDNKWKLSNRALSPASPDRRVRHVGASPKRRFETSEASEGEDRNEKRRRAGSCRRVSLPAPTPSTGKENNKEERRASLYERGMAQIKKKKERVRAHTMDPLAVYTNSGGKLTKPRHRRLSGSGGGGRQSPGRSGHLKYSVRVKKLSRRNRSASPPTTGDGSSVRRTRRPAGRFSLEGGRPAWAGARSPNTSANLDVSVASSPYSLPAVHFSPHTISPDGSTGSHFGFTGRPSDASSLSPTAAQAPPDLESISGLKKAWQLEHWRCEQAARERTRVEACRAEEARQYDEDLSQMLIQVEDLVRSQADLQMQLTEEREARKSAEDEVGNLKRQLADALMQIQRLVADKGATASARPPRSIPSFTSARDLAPADGFLERPTGFSAEHMSSLEKLTSICNSYSYNDESAGMVLDLFDRSVALLDSVRADDGSELAEQLVLLGDMARDLGQYNAAEGYYNRALSLFRAVGQQAQLAGAEAAKVAEVEQRLRYLTVRVEDVVHASAHKRRVSSSRHSAAAAVNNAIAAPVPTPLASPPPHGPLALAGVVTLDGEPDPARSVYGAGMVDSATPGSSILLLSPPIPAPGEIPVESSPVRSSALKDIIEESEEFASDGSPLRSRSDKLSSLHSLAVQRAGEGSYQAASYMLDCAWRLIRALPAGSYREEVSLLEDVLLIGYGEGNLEVDPGCRAVVARLLANKGPLRRAEAIGRMLLRKGEFNHGVQVIQRAIDELGGGDQAEDPEKRVGLTLLAARLKLEVGYFEGARRDIENSLGVAEGHKSRPLMLLCRRHGAMLYMQLDDVREAERECIEALLLAQELGDRPEEARCSQLLGDIKLRGGNIAGALQYFQFAALAFEDADDTRSIAGCLRARADCARLSKNWSSCLSDYRSAMSMYGKLRDVAKEAKVAVALGMAALEAGQADLAVENLSAGLTFFRRVTRPIMEGDGGSAFAIYQEVHGKRQQARILNLLGDSARLTRDLGKAQSSYQQAADAYRAIGFRKDERELLAKIEALEHERGRSPKKAALSPGKLAGTISRLASPLSPRSRGAAAK